MDLPWSMCAMIAEVADPGRIRPAGGCHVDPSSHARRPRPPPPIPPPIRVVRASSRPVVCDARATFGGRAGISLQSCARSWCSPATRTGRWRRAICDANWGCRSRLTEIRRFSNDCLYVQLQENCRQRDVYIVQPLVPPTQEHLMELLMMLDAARGASASTGHRGDPALRLRPLGQEGRVPHLDRRPARRRHADDRRRRPGADDDAARAAGARLLLGAGRSPHRDRRAGRPFPRTAISTDTVVVSPDLGNAKTASAVLPTARAAGGGRLEAAAGRRPGRHRRHRR